MFAWLFLPVWLYESLYGQWSVPVFIQESALYIPLMSSVSPALQSVCVCVCLRVHSRVHML